MYTPQQEEWSETEWGEVKIIELLSQSELAVEIVRGVFILLAAIVTGGFMVLAARKGGGLLGEFRKRKIYRIRGKLENACPHGGPSIINNEICIKTFFHSPSGTIWCFCRLCNSKVYEEDAVLIAEYLAGEITSMKGVKRLDKQLKKARRLREKLDALGNWAST